MENGEDNEATPQIPDDISELVSDIKERDAQRQKAIYEMLAKAEASISPEELEMWLLKVEEMEDIRDELRSQYPEIFPDEGE